MKQVKKRHFLLLEVLIAFFFIVVCAIPLIYPHVFILQKQRQFIDQITADHAANLAYAEIVRRLYENEIEFARIMDNSLHEIDDMFLRAIELPENFPYRGVYYFEDEREKPLEEATRKLYLLKLNLIFFPRSRAQHVEERSAEQLRYTYYLFAARESEGTSPSSEEPQNEEKPLES